MMEAAGSSKTLYVFTNLQVPKSNLPENSDIKTQVTQKPSQTQILTHHKVTA
jgi:hypothetical protein